MASGSRNIPAKRRSKMPTIFGREALEAESKKELDKVKVEKPAQFVVGGTWDGHTATGKTTFEYSWKNGWGAIAYAKAWYHDASVTPVGEKQFGGAVGGEVVKKLGGEK